jgi:hypothetical protein
VTWRAFCAEAFDKRLWTQGLFKKYNKMKGFSSSECSFAFFFAQKPLLSAQGQIFANHMK